MGQKASRRARRSGAHRDDIHCPFDRGRISAIRFCRAPNVNELIVAGGGARNPLMMAQLAATLPGIEIVASGQFGVPAEAKEAFAFAVLAYEAFHGARE